MRLRTSLLTVVVRSPRVMSTLYLFTSPSTRGRGLAKANSKMSSFLRLRPVRLMRSISAPAALRSTIVMAS